MKKPYSQFVCLSGLPRSGSTLISAILSQNPLIHAEGNSAVCQLMSDMHRSCFIHASEQLNANNRHETRLDLIKKIPHIYYDSMEEKIVVDKCRSWTLHIPLLKNFIDKKIKVIVLERNIIDIVKSFVKLYRQNGIVDESLEEKLLMPKTNPIMIPLHGLKWAKENNEDGTFLFIHYDDLLSDPKGVIDRIYEFCGWKPFDHDFDNIKPKYRENDSTYMVNGKTLNGFHSIRNRLCRESNDVQLHKTLEERCIALDEYFFRCDMRQ